MQDSETSGSQFESYCSQTVYLKTLILLPIVYNGAIQMSRLVGKPTICLGENKGADQLRSNREADQRLCFRYMDSTIPLLLKS